MRGLKTESRGIGRENCVEGTVVDTERRTENGNEAKRGEKRLRMESLEKSYKNGKYLMVGMLCPRHNVEKLSQKLKDTKSDANRFSTNYRYLK